jgi:hypothetical protein
MTDERATINTEAREALVRDIGVHLVSLHEETPLCSSDGGYNGRTWLHEEQIVNAVLDCLDAAGISLASTLITKDTTTKGWMCPWLHEDRTVFVVGGIAHAEVCGHRLEEHATARQRFILEVDEPATTPTSESKER